VIWNEFTHLPAVGVQDSAPLQLHRTIARARLPARQSLQERKRSPFILDSKEKEWTKIHNLGIGRKKHS